MPKAVVTVLGSGTSTGVPTLGCRCAVCRSSDPRDRRLRPSLWIQCEGRGILIDTSPDLRTQALRAGMESLDGVLFTHSHADHVMGLDDVRPFSLIRPDPLPLYASANTLADLRRVFRYIFSDEPTESARPRLQAIEIDGPFTLHGIAFEPLTVMHGSLPVLAFRFGRAAYVTDFNVIPEAAFERLRGLDVLILDALRHRPHPTHSNFANSIRLAGQLQPRVAYFTHMAHEVSHAATEAALPAGMHLAYDGLQLEVEV